jgi:hypothetical protein
MEWVIGAFVSFHAYEVYQFHAVIIQHLSHEYRRSQECSGETGAKKGKIETSEQSEC